jgi:flavorubredoxin
MESFLAHLKSKNYQKRKIGFIENGTWAPIAAKKMKEVAETFKAVEIIDPVVTIKSAMKADTVAKMEELADAIL